jgi:hypothetical protein
MTDSSPANPIDHSANLVFKPLDLAGVNTLVGWAEAEG